MGTFYGKYRGKVVNNVDPMMLGRLQVSVPAVLDDHEMSWATPCVPYAGNKVGFWAIPPKDANIWVEFEGGDPDYPIWSGCFWATGEVPADPALAEMTVLKTEGVSLIMSNLPGAGGLTLEAKSPAVSTPAKIKIDSMGIEITFGSQTIKLAAANISLNNGALEVM